MTSDERPVVHRVARRRHAPLLLNPRPKAEACCRKPTSDDGLKALTSDVLLLLQDDLTEEQVDLDLASCGLQHVCAPFPCDSNSLQVSQQMMTLQVGILNTSIIMFGEVEPTQPLERAGTPNLHVGF
jgi:hypothetical protein